MILDLLRPSLLSKLNRVLKFCRRFRYRCGRQVHCSVSPRPHHQFGFSSSIVTNNASLGDVNGVYHFYTSRNYPHFREALVSLTFEVAKAARELPQLFFYRVFAFSSEDDVKTYLSTFAELPDRELWLEKAVTGDWRQRHYFVREYFENGAWTPSITQGHEHLDLVADDIVLLDDA